MQSFIVYKTLVHRKSLPSENSWSLQYKSNNNILGSLFRIIPGLNMEYFFRELVLEKKTLQMVYFNTSSDTV